MKKMRFLLSCLSMLALAVSFSACDDNNDPDPVIEVPAPEVSLVAGEAGETTLSFTLTSAKAEKAAWVCVEKGTEVTAAEVLADGNSVEANKTLNLTAEGLADNTEYEIYAAAKNGTLETLSEALGMKTLEAVVPVPDPTVSVAPVLEKVTKEAVAFTITSENAEEVKYAVMPEMALEVMGTPTAETIYESSLDSVDPNTTVEVVKEVYMAETKFLVYAVAKAGDVLVLSEPAEITTLPEGSGNEDEEEPIVLVTPVPEKVTKEAVAFTITSENAEEVKYAVMPEMALTVMGTPTAETVYESSLDSVDPNTTVEVVKEVYMAETKFFVYAVAKAGDVLVLSEPAEITTLPEGGGNDDEDEYDQLPTPAYALMSLYEGNDLDKYTFCLSYDPPFDDPDADSRALYMMFDLYTETGLNGAVAEETYPIAGAEAGLIDPSSFIFQINGNNDKVLEGEVYICIYEDSNGKCASIFGELYTENSELPYGLMYDGPIDVFGVKQGGDAEVEEITFTAAEYSRPTDDALNPLAGQFNVFLQEGTTRVTLCFNGADKTYLGGDYYAVGRDASVAGPTGAWVDSELSSVEAGVPPIPEQLEAGDGSNYYVRVETLLDLEPTNPSFADQYAIEFYIKTKGAYSTPKVIHGTYTGPLGFPVGGESAMDAVELYYNYFESAVENGALKLNFRGFASGTMELVLNATELPTTVSEEFTWLDVKSGSMNEPYMGKGVFTENTGKLGVRYAGEQYDGSDDKTYPLYYFKMQSPVIDFSGVKWTSKNEWNSYQTGGSAAAGPVEVDLVFTKGVATTTADGTESVVVLKDASGNEANLTFRLPAAYANTFTALYGNQTMYLLANDETGGMEGLWTDATVSTLTYGGKTYKLPAADLNNEAYYGFNVTSAYPDDYYVIQGIMPIVCDGLTINSFTFTGTLYSGGEEVEKSEVDWSKVASGYKSMYVESTGDKSFKVRLNSFSNGDMVFFINGVDDIYGKPLFVGTEVSKESYMLQPAVEMDDDDIKSGIRSGYIMFNKTSDTSVTVLTGYKGDSDYPNYEGGDTRLKFESPTNIICFDSGDKGWTATLK